MKAAVLYAPRDLRIEERDVPKIGPHDVLVRVRSVGICGSDVHYFRTGHIGDFVVREPMILGHETSGVVAQVGERVTTLREGDRVAIEPGIPCRMCEPCKTGRYNLCPDVRFLATPPVDGSLCDYIASPEDFLYKIPDNVTFDEAALLEPLSVAIHACRRGGVEPGKSLLITGAGPIGLTTLMTALAYGASKVFVSDTQEHRLERARQLGALKTYDPRSVDVASAVMEETGGRGVDVAIECAGAESALQSCLGAATRGGRIVVVGLGDDATYSLPMVNLAVRELDIVGVFRYVFTYPAALDLVASGKVDMKKIVTHRFPFQDVLKGIDYSEKGRDGAIKVMIDMAD